MRSGKRSGTVNCSGPIQRREFLRIGLTAVGSLSLPGLFHFRANAGQPRNQTAVILVWLRGGASHLETYDPKPSAPSEYRGPYAALATKTPGLHISELLPRHALISNKFAILRSMAHTGGGHPAGSLQLLSGDPDGQDKLKPAYPDFMSVAHHLRADASRKLPNYVGVNPITRYDNFTIAGPAYLGPSYEPFSVTGDPNAPGFKVPSIGVENKRQASQLSERVSLQKKFDQLRRDLDQAKVMSAMDKYEAQALNLLTSSDAVRAFDRSGSSSQSNAYLRACSR
jgi:hypothetical protein